MTSASALLCLVLILLLASSSADNLSIMARANGGRLKHTRLYMHEITPVLAVVGDAQKFGMVGLLDDELRDGPDPSNSTLVGRFQGLVALAGLVTPPGMQSAISFVFTAGKHRGSTLVMVGYVLSFEGAFERPLVGGTGKFRMARGYCVTAAVSNSTAVYPVYELDLFVKMHRMPI